MSKQEHWLIDAVISRDSILEYKRGGGLCLCLTYSPFTPDRAEVCRLQAVAGITFTYISHALDLVLHAKDQETENSPPAFPPPTPLTR